MKRKEILPKWIRLFSWIFLLMSIVPIFYLYALIFNVSHSFRIFGFSYFGNELTFISLLIVFMMSLSAVVSFGILWGKNWAIKVDNGLGLGVDISNTLPDSKTKEVTTRATLNINLGTPNASGHIRPCVGSTINFNIVNINLENLF